MWAAPAAAPCSPSEDGQRHLVPTSSLEKQDRLVGLNHTPTRDFNEQNIIIQISEAFLGSVCVGDWRHHLLTRVTGNLEEGLGAVAASGPEDQPPEEPAEPCVSRVLAASL